MKKKSKQEKSLRITKRSEIESEEIIQSEIDKLVEETKDMLGYSLRDLYLTYFAIKNQSLIVV